MRASVLLCCVLVWGCSSSVTADSGTGGGGGTTSTGGGSTASGGGSADGGGSPGSGGGGGSVGGGSGGGSGGGAASSGGGSQPVCTTTFPAQVDDGGSVASWVWENPRPVGDDFTSIWGASPNDAWAVANTWLLHWDGTDFALTQTDERLIALWGTGASNIWAVGANGAALHWDGATWSKVSTATTANLLAIWGTGPNDVWAVGTHSTIIHWNGTAWTPSTHPSPPNPTIDDAFTSVWGSGSTNVWVGGANDVVLRFNGTTWSALQSPLQQGAYAPSIFIAGSGPNDVYLASYLAVMHWNGTAWSDVTAAANHRSGYICSLFGGGSDVWVVSCDGLATNWDGSFWTPHYPLGSTTTLFAWSPNDVFAAGRSGSFFSGRRGLSAGDPIAPPTGGGTGGGGGVTGGGGGFAGGGGGGTGGGTSDGGEDNGWVRLSAGPRATPSAMWVGDAGVWAVGWSSALSRSPDGTWTSSNLSGAGYVMDVWGSADDDVWAVGEKVLHYDGMTWSAADAGIDRFQLLEGVWGSSANDVWAVGRSGLVLHFDGAAWAQVDAGTSSDLGSVWGRSSDDVWAAGSADRSVLHWDGSAWTAVDAGAPAANQTYALGGTANQLFLVGRNGATGCGTIQKFDGTNWSTVEGNELFSSLVVRGDDDLWVAGRSVRHWNGSALSARTRGLDNAGFVDMAALGDDMLAITSIGQAVRIH